MPSHDRPAETAQCHSNTGSKKSRQKRTWLVYLGVFIVYEVIFHLTKPEVLYENNVVFQQLVAAGVAILLARAALELHREPDLGQVLKVVFWVGLEVYILEDTIYFFKRFNRAFPHFPEFLVLCYVIAVILKEKRPAQDHTQKATS
jgi:hypothetical protein